MYLKYLKQNNNNKLNKFKNQSMKNKEIYTN